MKYKTMRRDNLDDNWVEILKKDFYIQDSYLKKGRTSLIHILEVTNPVGFTYQNGKDFIMCDVDYRWLQIAYENIPFWITAFFTPNGELIQIYIDLIGHSDFSNMNNPKMDDQYIDVIIENNTYHTLDLDEFEEAYLSSLITKTQYETTLMNYHQLIEYLDFHLVEFIENVKLEYQMIQEHISYKA